MAGKGERNCNGSGLFVRETATKEGKKAAFFEKLQHFYVFDKPQRTRERNCNIFANSHRKHLYLLAFWSFWKILKTSRKGEKGGKVGHSKKEKAENAGL